MPSPTQPRWEAILHAAEQDPGHWHMHADPGEDPYACVRLLEIEVNDARVKRYRVVTWARTSTDRRLVGYYTTLKRACEEARKHRQHEVSAARQAAEAAGGPPWGNWGGRAPRYGGDRPKRG